MSGATNHDAAMSFLNQVGTAATPPVAGAPAISEPVTAKAPVVPAATTPAIPEPVTAVVPAVVPAAAPLTAIPAAGTTFLSVDDILSGKIKFVSGDKNFGLDLPIDAVYIYQGKDPQFAHLVGKLVTGYKETMVEVRQPLFYLGIQQNFRVLMEEQPDKSRKTVCYSRDGMKGSKFGKCDGCAANSECTKKCGHFFVSDNDGEKRLHSISLKNTSMKVNKNFKFAGWMVIGYTMETNGSDQWLNPNPGYAQTQPAPPSREKLTFALEVLDMHLNR